MPILQPLKGLAPEYSGSRPTIDTSADDELLSRLGLFDAGLLHAVDPQSWDGSSPVDYREKASGRRVRANIAPDMIDDAYFDGRRIMDFDNIPTSTDMRIKGSHGSANLTWVFVGTRPAIARTGYALCTSLRSSKFMQQLRLSSAGDFYFSNVGGGVGNLNQVDITDLPAPSATDAHVYAVSYHDATKESAMFVDDGLTALNTFTHPLAADASTSDEICIGGVGQATGGSTGWFAKIGRVFVFDNALHVNHPTVLGDLCAALREIYDI